MKRRFGLHPTVLLLASTHFLVDGFSNIYAPLLPLLIPELNLSLAAAGTLQMCFQMANSVAQLGFGHIADRWRPRALLLVGPIVTVTLLPFLGLANTAVALGYVSFRIPHLNWRDAHPALAVWFEDFALRSSMQATAPVA